VEPFFQMIRSALDNHRDGVASKGKKDGDVLDSSEVAGDKQKAFLLPQGIVDFVEGRSVDTLVKKRLEVRYRLIGVEKLFTIVMQDTSEHFSRERFDFTRTFCLCKGLADGLNDLSLFFCTEEIVEASKKGDIPESQRPSHFLNQRDVRLPLQEGAQVFPHAFLDPFGTDCYFRREGDDSARFFHALGGGTEKSICP